MGERFSPSLTPSTPSCSSHDLHSSPRRYLWIYSQLKPRVMMKILLANGSSVATSRPLTLLCCFSKRFSIRSSTSKSFDIPTFSFCLSFTFCQLLKRTLCSEHSCLHGVVCTLDLWDIQKPRTASNQCPTRKGQLWYAL